MPSPSDTNEECLGLTPITAQVMRGQGAFLAAAFHEAGSICPQDLQVELGYADCLPLIDGGLWRDPGFTDHDGDGPLIKGMFSYGSMPVLERMVQFTGARQELIAHNIANLSTPYYKPVDLDRANSSRSCVTRWTADRVGPTRCAGR